jgi:hypothetical protein
MAIRDDFTAGEVLAAADLNDTFNSKIPYAYGTATPSTTVDGFVWFDENSTPPAPKFWDGAAFQLVSPPSGLVHIATESFSAVSSVSLNGVFTSTYENYAILGNITPSGSVRVDMKLRVSGSDASTNYQNQLVQANATLSGTRTTAQTEARLGSADGTLTSFDIKVFGPQIAAVTQISSEAIRSNSDVTLDYYLNRHTTASAYDGFTIFPSSGTFTGTVRIYGYQNS